MLTRVFIERQGFLQQVPGVSIGERSLMVAVKNIARRLGDDISESRAHSRLAPARWLKCRRRDPRLQSRRRHAHDSQVQCTRHFGDPEDLILGEGHPTQARLANHLVKTMSLRARTSLFAAGLALGKSTLYFQHPRQNSFRKEERVLVIEDTAEIQLPQQNLSAASNARREQNGLPAVAIHDSCRASLSVIARIALILGRSAEARPSISRTPEHRDIRERYLTIHASSAATGPQRGFTSCVLQSGVEHTF